MADKRISQLIERVDIANNDVLPIVASGATTTNKVTISTLQDWMQDNLDVGVTSVGITIGSTGTDVNVSGSPVTSSGNITINLPTASATNRGLLSAADWTTFNNKANAGDYVTLATTQTITAQKTFTTSGSSDTMIISHGSGSGFALDVLKAGNGEAIRVTKSSGTGNAMTISGGNFEAPTIVKTGGTSSQFLKADGSVDSSTYLTTGSAGSTYVPYSGASASVNLGVYSITANAINSAGSGSTAGQINLRSDAFFTLVNGYGSIASGTTNQFNFYQTTGAGVFRGAIFSLNSITASATRTYTLPDASGTLALTSDIPANPVGGTGTANIIPKFTGGSTLGDSSLQNVSNSISNLNPPSGQFAWQLNGNATTGQSFGALVVAGTNSSDIAFAVRNTGGVTTLFEVQGDGNVGVGTNTPLSKFHVNTGTNGNLRIRQGTDVGAANGACINTRSDDDSILQQLTLRASDVLMLTTGNVGIGTASPNRLTEIVSSSGGVLGVASTQNGAGILYGRLAFYTTAASNEFINYGGEIRSFSGSGIDQSDLRFYTAGGSTSTERMRITSGGFTKSTSTGSYFGISGSFHELNSNSVNSAVQVIHHTASSGAYGIYVKFSSSPNNNGNNFIECADGTEQKFIVYSTGNVVNRNNSYGAISDEKLKENVEDATPKLDDLMKVKVRNYNLIGDDKKQIGVIAQELEEVFPAMIDELENFEEVEVPQVDEEGNEVLNEEGEVVTTKEKVSTGTTTKSVKYSVFVPMLIKAMQELKTEIDSLKNQMQ